jgi:asparagine synthase (glutamine-hydrolysing)
MCGLCGFNWQDPKLIKAMTDAIRHRGPDSDGFFTDQRVSLGARRLSIIDLRPVADQPITNETKTVHLVYNGEIYNFSELADELKSKGHKFATRTDSEVIVHAYEEYGPKCLEKFSGMFAFALWDSRTKRLMLVRDRIGIKPLYYYWHDNKLVFASEIKAILECPEVVRQVNPQAMYDYLGFEFVPAPETMFAHVYKLPPGHYLIYENGQIQVREWWDLDFSPKQQSAKDIIEKTREMLDKYIRRILVSDVPVGVFLSGGLDSSCVVAYTRKYLPGTLKTFTIAYRDKTYSELDYAQEVAQYCGAENEVLYIDQITTQDLEKTIWHLDEPMTDMSTIPFYLICQKARQNVTVALSGEGGDEVFVGYDRIKASHFYHNYYRWLPNCINKVIYHLVEGLPDQPQKKGLVNVARRFVQGAALPEAGEHLRWQYFSNSRHDENLFNPGLIKEVNRDRFVHIERYTKKHKFPDRLSRELYVDLRFTMPDSVLMKVDKMSMAHSLEVRVPLLEYELVEYFATVPAALKYNAFTTKAIFRKAIADLLPPRIVQRGKQGYSFPSKNWLREQFKDYMMDVLHSSSWVKEDFNMIYIDTLIKEHLERQHNHNHVLWGLINMAVWHNQFIKK